MKQKGKKLKAIRYFLYYFLLFLRPVVKNILLIIEIIFQYGGFLTGIVVLMDSSLNIPIYVPIIGIAFGFLASILRDRYDILILRLNPNEDIDVILF